jgi:hypothetical protein
LNVHEHAHDDLQVLSLLCLAIYQQLG